MCKYILGMIIALILNGCVVGDAVALPFRVTGAVVNVVTPDVVGDSISTTGDAIDTSIPF
ncbi:DUF6726 family protein [Halarcobacter sp.]|uniref:DUF6726 family protein n=1 Tax=Halarcobacter sp. TaxID=2321133 RepID=UPI0029F4FD00|nr:DUF6726 family protein [Halarcobacter sp.]